MEFIIPIVSILATVAISVYSTRTSRKSTKEANNNTVSGFVFERLTKAEEQIERLWKAREADALVKRRAGDHIDVLEKHIWDQLPPPPPPRPDGI